jgi:hypothetical protein
VRFCGAASTQATRPRNSQMAAERVIVAIGKYPGPRPAKKSCKTRAEVRKRTEKLHKCHASLSRDRDLPAGAQLANQTSRPGAPVPPPALPLDQSCMTTTASGWLLKYCRCVKMRRGRDCVWNVCSSKTLSLNTTLPGLYCKWNLHEQLATMLTTVWSCDWSINN